MYKTKEKCDTQENLVSALETIESVKILNKDQFLGTKTTEPFEVREFCRYLEIEVNGTEYTIEWYHNLSTIQSEFIEAPFDTVALKSPTWPLKAGSKLKLQLMQGDIVSVVI